jgi:uncharacterized protein YggE
MKKIALFLIILATAKSISQTKNYIDQPLVETSAKVDTLVTPDKIYLTILLAEKDSRGKISVEELENTMISKLQSLKVEIEKQLTLNDVASNYKRYLLKNQDINKSKSYSLLVYDSKEAGNVLAGLEEIGISNVSLDRTEFSKVEDMRLTLKSKAVVKAKKIAIALTKPFNQKVGNAIYITDGNMDSYNMLSGKVSGITVTKKSLGYAVSNVSNQEIEFQKIRIVAEVNVTFKLE